VVVEAVTQTPLRPREGLVAVVAVWPVLLLQEPPGHPVKGLLVAMVQALRLVCVVPEAAAGLMPQVAQEAQQLAVRAALDCCRLLLVHPPITLVEAGAVIFQRPRQRMRGVLVVAARAQETV
jgi:hypothetical protein